MEPMLAPYKKLYRAIKGRSGRQEYWMFFLLFLALHIVPLILFFGMFGGISSLDPQNMAGAMAGLGIITMLLFIPLYAVLAVTYLAMAAVSIRRLHDIGITGWVYVALYVVLFIPFLNFLAMIVYLVLMALPGTAGPNKYGAPNDEDESAGAVFS
ncbi:DUF805 domain-containing protein [Aurantiacibacter gilvus]|uniref:DUF805 domain-containing protein n=1 Tax=Aurantiacibacter gilvus TaxID=3139141 RepID=A0ABU9IAX2_9SPHN